MKKIILVLLFSLIVSNVYAFDITVTIPDNKKDDLIEAFVNSYRFQGYTDYETGMSDSQIEEQFMLQKILDYIKRKYKDYKITNKLKIEKQNVTLQAETEISEFTIK